MFKKSSGFTIVELLIVIVVIAILAVISVVAYNGVQQRANNTKTADALNGWVKALRYYRTENGQYPNAWTCLGGDYLYGPTGTDTSGVAQCRQDVAGAGYVRNTSFENTMKPYLNGALPTPAFVTAKSSDTQWVRGIMYAYGGGSGTDVYLIATFSGDVTCPGVQGMITGKSVWGGNTRCIYTLGQTTDPV